MTRSAAAGPATRARPLCLPMSLVAMLLVASPAGAQRGTTSTVVSAPPGPPPTGLYVKAATPTSATIAWQPVAGATGYTVTRALDARGPWAVLTPTPVTAAEFTESAAYPPGTTQLFRVTALVPMTVAGSADVLFLPPPVRNPTSVAAQVQGTDVTISWTPVPGASSYTIAGPGGFWVREVPASRTTERFANAPPGTHTISVGTRYYPGPIESPAGEWPGTQVVVHPSARFRVYLTGATVDQRTMETGLDPSANLLASQPRMISGTSDPSPGDEVFINARVLRFDRTTGTMTGGDLLRSPVYGFADLPGRHIAGMMTVRGGIGDADVVPYATNPTVPGGVVSRDKLPLLLFDGDLRQNGDFVAIAPTIWKEFGKSGVYDAWNTQVTQASGAFGTRADVRTALGWPQVEPVWERIRYQGPADRSQDRPIGVTKLAAPYAAMIDAEYLVPWLILTREKLDAALAGASSTMYRLRYQDTGQGLRGDYSLWLVFERIP